MLCGKYARHMLFGVYKQTFLSQVLPCPSESEHSQSSSVRSSLHTECVTDLIGRVQSGHFQQGTSHPGNHGNHPSLQSSGPVPSLGSSGDLNTFALTRALHSGQKFGSGKKVHF